MRHLAVFLVFSCSFFIQGAFGGILDEVVQAAVKRSSSLSAQEMEGHALMYDANLKSKWQNPQLIGQFGTLKSGDVTGPTVEVSITQYVPLSDKFSLKKELALLAVKNQKRESDFFRNWVSHQAVLASWRLQVTEELLKHGEERARRLSLVKKYLQTRPKVTIKQRVELSIISSTLLQLEKVQDQKEHDYEVAKSDFKFWVGEDFPLPKVKLHLPDRYQYQFQNDIKVDTSRDIELAHAKTLVKMAELDHEIAQKERRPDLYLGGGYRVENVTPENHFSYAIVGMNLPIWDTGANRLVAAKIREKRDRKNLEETEKRLILKHRKQIELVNFNIEQLKRFPKAFIAENEKSIKEAERGFRQGLLDVNTFITAETQSHEVIDQVFIAWMSYLESLSSLQLMNGEPFNWELKQ